METLGFNMVSQVPLDTMHLIDLGVTRKMLIRLVNNKITIQILREKLSQISENLLGLQRFIPSEFVRKPRSLDDIFHWKATEFRQFLAYTGPAVLKDLVDEDFYYEFMLFHCAYRLINCPRQINSNLQQAHDLLQLFVSNFPIVFGNNNITFNVHSLIHLVTSVERYGVASNFSAYSFENKLQTLKKHVRKSTKILEQIVFNEKEQQIIRSENYTFKYSGGTIVSFYFNKALYSINDPNSFCSMKPNVPIKITRFIDGEKKFIEGRKIESYRSFFTEPLESCTLGIYVYFFNITSVNFIDQNIFTLLDVFNHFLSVHI